MAACKTINFSFYKLNLFGQNNIELQYWPFIGYQPQHDNYLHIVKYDLLSFESEVLSKIHYNLRKKIYSSQKLWVQQSKLFFYHLRFTLNQITNQRHQSWRNCKQIISKWILPNGASYSIFLCPWNTPYNDARHWDTQKHSQAFPKGYLITIGTPSHCNLHKTDYSSLST